MVHTDVKPKLVLLDWMLELASVFLVFTLISLPLYVIQGLPQEIPVHFNFLGEPNKYGNKQTLWVVVIIGFIIYLLVTILNFFPSIYNYPVTITDKNYEIQYKLASRMMRWLKFLTLAGFLYGILKMIFVNSYFADNSWIVLPIIVVSIFFVIALYFFKMVANKATY